MMMINIVGKKNQVRELVSHSSLCKLMGLQEKLLHNLNSLPDEIPQEDVGLLDAIEKIVSVSGNDSDMQETLQIFLKLQEAWQGLTALEEQTLKDQIAITEDAIRRLDEIKARRDKDPNATIDDLLLDTKS